MKNTIIRYINLFLLLVIIISIIYLAYYNSQKEGFTTTDDLDYYVVSMSNADRLNNIQTQNEKLKSQTQNNEDKNNNIQIIDAVVGEKLNLDELKKNGNLSPKFNDTDKNAKIKNVIGCYLSHLKIYDKISANNANGYSVIFEDDFSISDDFYEKMADAIHTIKTKNIDFDMCFLGVLGNTPDEQLTDNIYKCSVIYGGTHGYLINNKNAKKIISRLEYMEEPIDLSIFKKNLNNELTVYKLNESIVFQNGMQSSLR